MTMTQRSMVAGALFQCSLLFSTECVYQSTPNLRRVAHKHSCSLVFFWLRWYRPCVWGKHTKKM